MKNKINSLPFVLITPARDEQEFIAHTIRSVIAQTARPIRWVIINDGSEDNTRQVVESFLAKNDFIQLINIDRGGGRNFGSKALAFCEAYNRIKDLDFEYVGNLDADISVSEDYYHQSLRAMEEDSRVGIVGGCVGEVVNGQFKSDDLTPGSVGGAVQFFRRSCYEEVGGYKPMTYGGIDAAVEIKAKSLGWTVKKLLDQKVVQHRGTGSVGMHFFASKLRDGRRFHSLGYGLVYYFLRCLFRIRERPFLIGSLVSFLGYLDSTLRCRPTLLEPQVVEYWRREHFIRLRHSFQSGCPEPTKGGK